MKHLKNLLYIFVVFAAAGFTLCLSTLAAQLGTEAAADCMGIPMKDEWLFEISGGLGTALTGALFAYYVKKKHYTDCIKAKEPFRLKKCLYYCAIALSVCNILFYAVTTVIFVYGFSMTDEIHVITEKSLADILLREIFFPVLSAPVFEELLFRMGLYSLMRQRFGEQLSVLLCTFAFAAIHGYSIQGFCSCLIAGFLYMIFYLSTGNIWYSIAAHMIGNLDATISNAFEDKVVTFLGIPLQYEINGFNMVHPVLIIAAALFCGFCLIKKWKTAEKKNGA